MTPSSVCWPSRKSVTVRLTCRKSYWKPTALRTESTCWKLTLPRSSVALCMRRNWSPAHWSNDTRSIKWRMNWLTTVRHSGNVKRNRLFVYRMSERRPGFLLMDMISEATWDPQPRRGSPQTPKHGVRIRCAMSEYAKSLVFVVVKLWHGQRCGMLRLRSRHVRSCSAMFRPKFNDFPCASRLRIQL